MSIYVIRWDGKVYQVAWEQGWGGLVNVGFSPRCLLPADGKCQLGGTPMRCQRRNRQTRQAFIRYFLSLFLFLFLVTFGSSVDKYGRGMPHRRRQHHRIHHHINSACMTIDPAYISKVPSQYFVLAGHSSRRLLLFLSRWGRNISPYTVYPRGTVICTFVSITTISRGREYEQGDIDRQ